jgi:putative PEP-CTERM system TPR-repeat lipoprotein
LNARPILLCVLLFAVSFATVQADEELISEAAQSLQAGDVPAAIIHLKNALKEDPGASRARLMLGSIYLDQGNGPSAEKEYRRARSLSAHPEKWEVPLATALLMQGKAQEVLNEIELERPRNPSRQAAVLNAHARALQALDKPESALNRFDDALAIDPSNVPALVGKGMLLADQRQFDQALELGGKAAGIEPNDVEAQLLLARIKLHKGDQQGVDHLNRALEIDPDDAEALYLRAQYFAQRREHKAALKDIKKLRVNDPSNIGALYLGAIVAFQEGQFALAQEQAGMVLRIAPGHDRSLVLYGVTALLQGQDEIAADYLQRARSRGASQLQIGKLTAAIYLRNGSYDRALDALGGGVLQGNDIQALVLAGNAYLAKGDQARGYQAFGRAIELAPTTPELRTQLGIGMLQYGRGEEGMQMLESAIDLAGDSLQPGMILVMGKLHQADIPAAREAALALESENPESARVISLSGVVLLAADEYNEARARFERVLELEPGNTGARIQLARVALAQQNDDEAQRQFQKILETEQNNYDAIIGLMALADNTGNTKGVEQWSARALEVRPGSVQPVLLKLDHYLRQGRTDDAAKMAASLAQQHADNQVALYHAARAELAAGNTESAINRLSAALKLDPSSRTTRLLLAQTLLGSGKIATATDVLAPLRADNEDVEAQATLAALELKARRVDSALQIAQRLVDSFPERAEGYRVKGLALVRAGRGGEAIDALRRAYAISKSGEVARLLAGLMTRANDKQGAAQILEDWLKATPTDTEARRQLAVQYQLAGEPKDAARHYEVLIQADAADAAALNNLAWIRFEEGDAIASTLAQRAYEAQPNNPSVIDSYAWILFRQTGETREPLRLLKEAKLRQPTGAEISFHLASVLAASGESESARTVLKSLLARHPQFDDLDEARALLSRLDSTAKKP